MSTGKAKIRNVPPPAGHDPKAGAYARFIPREELDSFSSWRPSAFSDSTGATGPGAAPAAAGEDAATKVAAARSQGYQDGYRDGLAALEQFKQSHAMQLSSQIGALLASIAGQLDALQQQMAESVAVTAAQLARQVVRSELEARPQLVAQVAAEAIDALLLSARHVTLRVHPADHEFVALGAADVIVARNARLVSDAGIERGGCVVESDIGSIDAGVASRWARAVAALGTETPWHDAAGDGEPA